MKHAWKAVLAGLVVAAIATPAAAAPVSEGFSTWTAQNPLTDGQAESKGWNYNAEGTRDVELVANGINGQSIRMSNAVTDDSFGDWLYSQRITPVTEDANGNEFIAEFDIKSATGVYEPGLQISVSPQSGDGARMSFLRFVDTPDGIDVIFVDVQADDGATQRSVKIASGLDYASAHHIKIVLDLYQGAHNDVAQVFIDSNQPRIPMTVTGFDGFFAPVDHPDTMNKLKAGQSVPMKWKIGSASPATTWEDYYRFQSESNGGVPQDQWTTRSVDSLIFQARTSGGTRANTTFGGGFFVDNVTLDSSTTATLPNPTTTPGDASIYTEPIFTAKQVDCSSGDDVDQLEQVATPGASQLTYDAATGVWHYSWQTTNTMKNTCVKLTLNLTDDYALFKIVK